MNSGMAASNAWRLSTVVSKMWDIKDRLTPAHKAERLWLTAVTKRLPRGSAHDSFGARVSNLQCVH